MTLCRWVASRSLPSGGALRRSVGRLDEPVLEFGSGPWSRIKISGFEICRASGRLAEPVVLWKLPLSDERPHGLPRHRLTLGAIDTERTRVFQEFCSVN